MATVLACAGFAAICGSTAATAATMGKIALPEMKKYGYDDTLATGTVASAGTLGILIPPSTVFLVYAILTEQSIGKLFIAGIVLDHPQPDVRRDRRDPLRQAIPLALRPVTTWQKVKATSGIIEALLFLLAIGGLMLGWFSPTQGGAIGAAGGLLIGLSRRTLTWKSFVETGKDGLLTSCMVLFIIAGAIVFGHFMAVSKIPFRSPTGGELPSPHGVWAVSSSSISAASSWTPWP
jgi:tripartite ATP-independent transporter DctM subunit